MKLTKKMAVAAGIVVLAMSVAACQGTVNGGGRLTGIAGSTGRNGTISISSSFNTDTEYYRTAGVERLGDIGLRFQATKQAGSNSIRVAKAVVSAGVAANDDCAVFGGTYTSIGKADIGSGPFIGVVFKADGRTGVISVALPGDVRTGFMHVGELTSGTLNITSSDMAPCDEVISLIGVLG